MYDEYQKVKIKWNNTNREWYESKGYKYTKRYDVFEVFAKDIKPGSDVKIKAVCDYCGKEYKTIYASIINGRKVVSKDACSCCNGLKGKEVTLNKRAERCFNSLVKVCEENNYDLLTDKSEFTSVKMQIRFRCKKHGEQSMMADNLIRGHKCKECSYESRFNSMRYSKEYISSYIASVNENTLLNPDDYSTVVKRNLRIRCKCGNEYVTSFANFERYNVNSCFSCSCKESAGEVIIRKFLESNNILFEQEKRFSDCRDIRPLPFDFYLPQYNLCIEFDGKQHFGEMSNSIFDYNTISKHDKIKNDYCLDHGIDIIRIPYYDGNNIAKILKNKLEI